MKIGIDATEMVMDQGGVRQYIINLLQSLKKIDNENIYLVIFHAWKKNLVKSYKQLQSLCQAENFILRWIKFPGRIIFALHIPIDLFTGPMDVYHGAGHFVDNIRHGNTVFTVHDLDYHTIPDLLTKEWVIKKTIFFKRSIQRASAIIVPSNFIKESLLSLFPEKKAQVFVIHHGISNGFFQPPNKKRIMVSKGKYGIPDDYILFVGQINRNKNLLRLIDVYRILKQKNKIPHDLVLIGKKWPFYQELYHYVTDMGLQNEVLFPGFVEEADLPDIYMGASLFVFPSLYEGFGIPVLEAMASGLPVVASSSASLPEVCGDAALLVDPLQVEEMAHTMYRVLSDSQLKKTLIHRGIQRAKHFTWEKTAKKTLNVYQSVSQ